MPKQKLVELVVRDKKVCIKHNGQPAQGIEFVTGIVALKHYGRPYEEIKADAPEEANAFLSSSSRNSTGGLTAGIQVYFTHLIYLHINSEQVRDIPEPVDPPERDPPSYSYDSSDAD